jgi:GAF domain-containing protein
LPFGQGLAGAAYQATAVVVTQDYAGDPMGDPAAVASGVRSGLAVPVRARQEIVAIFSVASPTPGQFPPERVRLLTTVANAFAPLFEAARADEERRLRTRELSALNEAFQRQLSEWASVRETHEEILDGLGGLANDASLILEGVRSDEALQHLAKAVFDLLARAQSQPLPDIP